MDDHQDDLQLQDDELGATLRRRAGEVTGPIDVETALTDVLHRSRSRRRPRVVVTTVSAAAAAATVVIVGVIAVGGADRQVVRGPAAQPSAPVSTTAPADVVTTSPGTAGAVVPPVTSLPDASLAVPTSTTVEPATTAPPGALSTTPYVSAGGAISVRLGAGQISLDGDPVPNSGWSAQINDDGPTRVRVRFERGDERSEIRVDLEAGLLVPRITEG